MAFNIQLLISGGKLCALLVLLMDLRCWCMPCVLTSDHLSGLVLNCSDSSFSRIPHNLPSVNVTTLDLSNNRITMITGLDLVNFTDLIHLNLVNNLVENISDDAFSSLTMLKILNLRFNKFLDWPDKCLSSLRNLRELNLDEAIGGSLGILPAGFHNLTHLETITLSALNFGALDSQFFSNLHKSTIRYMDLGQSKAKVIKSGAFVGFILLERLVLSAFKGINNSNLPLIMSDLNNTNLVELNLSNMLNITKLEKRTFAGFSNNCLQKLVLSNSEELRVIAPGSFTNLVCLEKLLLDNTDLQEVSTQSFSGLLNLSTLDLTGSNIKHYNFTGTSLTQLKTLIMSNTLHIHSLKTNALSGLTNLTHLVLSGTGVEVIEACAFCGLSNIQSIEFTYNHLIKTGLSKDAFKGIPNLVKLDLTESGIPYFNRSLFEDLHELKSLTLDGNYLRNTAADDAFAPVKNTLQNLSLADCNLVNTRGLFKNLFALTNLSIKLNSELALSDKMFEGSTNLSHLTMSFIKAITALPKAVWPKYLPNLNYLDISSCGIKIFSKQDVEGFLDISTLKKFLGGNNPFNCSNCDLKYFATWFNHTPIIADDPIFYRCNDQASLNEYDFSICSVQSLKPIIIGMTAGFVVLICVGVILVYRYRWTLRTLWYVHQLQQYRALEVVEDDPEIEFDAFVCYSSQDRTFVRDILIPNLENPSDPDARRFHLAVDFIHFFQGKSVGDNVIEYINKSRRTILLLNENFIHSHWTIWEYEMAHSAVADGLDVIIPVLIGPINQRSMQKLPRSLRELLKNISYIEWTDDPEGQKLFWRKLKDALSRPRSFQRLSAGTISQIAPEVVEDDPEFEFDAFTCYSSKDYNFVLDILLPNLENPSDPDARRFHLAVDFIHFLPGKSVNDNVIEYINKSRRTILLLNENFINSQWTIWEYEMAHLKKVADGLDVIIPVLIGPINQRNMQKLPHSLRQLLKKRLYIEWTEDPDGQTIFWRKLRDALSRPTRIQMADI